MTVNEVTMAYGIRINGNQWEECTVEEPASLPEAEQIRRIGFHFEQIMRILGLDLDDDSLRGTPMRVAKMYVQEVFSGLNPDNYPEISLFDNRYGYREMLVVKDIELYSYCEHHFVPIVGKAHLAYFPGEKVIGLSKLNRLVQYFAKRPQVQEKLTQEIAGELKEVLQCNDVAVYIEADHLCVSSRGIRDSCSNTVTSHYSGKFIRTEIKNEFLAAIR